jgi:hypothetical protein
MISYQFISPKLIENLNLNPDEYINFQTQLVWNIAQ